MTWVLLFCKEAAMYVDAKEFEDLKKRVHLLEMIKDFHIHEIARLNERVDALTSSLEIKITDVKELNIM